MNALTLTGHATVRMAQRGIEIKDSELIAMIGSEVHDGYYVREKDYQEVERILKQLLQRCRRVRGKRLVVTNGQIITAYHACDRHERRLLRNARECGGFE
jgi:hypothetical protein